MATGERQPVNWRVLWLSGDLLQFCIVSLGIFLHAGVETMISTIMAAMVEDIGGVQLVGWSFAIYEVGAITAGAAMGRLSMRYAVGSTMASAAIVYSVGCVIAALAPAMPVLLCGRLIEGFGGGALVAMAFVATERLFTRDIWPQLMSILSVVWGIAAFSGPLIGASIASVSSWRWAFAAFGIAGAVLAFAFGFLLHKGSASHHSDRPGMAAFPWLAILCLAASVMLISAAGIEISVLRSAIMLAAGIVGITIFFWLDAHNRGGQLFPAYAFDVRSRLGSGFLMVACLSISTISFTVYGPLLLVSLHDFSPLLTGYIIASESISWSILSIMVAGAPPRSERLIIIAGALMIAVGIVGFGFAVPSGSLPWICVCALLQGGGFGISWPFVMRRIVESVTPEQRSIAASAVPALQRLGYAIGAAIAGILANYYGFSAGFTETAAARAAPVLFFAFAPLALVGAIAAIRFSSGTAGHTD